MNTYRPNRVVSMLTAVVSIAYFGLMAVAIAVLTLAPIARLLPGVDSSWEWGLNFPAVVHASGAAVHIGGGDGQVLVEEARGLLTALAKVLSRAEAVTFEEQEAALARAEVALWAWYLEWSGIARAIIKDRRVLASLGFRGRGRKKS